MAIDPSGSSERRSPSITPPERKAPEPRKPALESKSNEEAKEPKKAESSEGEKRELAEA